MPAIDVVSVCVFYDETLLTLRRSPHRSIYPGAWEVVSGRVRMGEDLNQAAAREVTEETSLHVDLATPLVDRYDAAYGDATMHVHVFVAQAATPTVVLSEEHDAFRWVTLEEFASTCPFERLVEGARRAFAHL